ncbi:dipicolinate synthase subunit A, partial [Bacillus thuringiensis]|nr:dipicolinate synthase subunit A [Bacillus thuringiensis]
TIHGSNVMVLGFGRTGMSVARAFQSLGAHLKVGARRTEHIARITEMKFSPFHMTDIGKEVGNIYIVINTITHLAVTA